MEFEVKIKLKEGWYDDIDFGEVVRDSCMKAVRDWVREETIETLTRDGGRTLAIQKILDNGLWEAALPAKFKGAKDGV